MVYGIVKNNEPPSGETLGFRTVSQERPSTMNERDTAKVGLKLSALLA
jgi:hypothetical protein